MHWECRERFPCHWLQRKPLVSDPDMHHGTCVTHMPWCMSGSLTHVDGENVTGIPGACTTHNFTYLVRGPYEVLLYFLSSWTVQYDYVHQRRNKVSLLLRQVTNRCYIPIFQNYLSTNVICWFVLTLYDTLITKESGNIIIYLALQAQDIIYLIQPPFCCTLYIHF